MSTYEIIFHLLVIANSVIAIIIALKILRQKWTPGGTIAWILTIFFIPFLGVILYFIFGGRKTRIIANKKSEIFLDKLNVIPDEKANQFDKLLRAYDIPGAVSGNKINICENGEIAYNQLINLITAAEKSIFLLTFILAEDETGKEVVNRLVEKAGKGVSVYVLLDGLGSMHTRYEFLKPLIAAGGKFAFFNPVLKSPFHGRANLRNHRKMLITDEKNVMAGGTNIAVEYIGPNPQADRWKDLAFVLEGPAVKHYASVFVSDWKYVTGENIELSEKQIEQAGESVIQIVPSGPDVPGDPMYDFILTAAFSAKKSLWIVTPYFVPDEPLAQALTLCAHRGIDLRIIVPEKSNHRLTDLARETYLRDIQKSGGKIYLYNKMVHAKTLIIDDNVVSIGSANMDMRSLFLNYEISMLSYTPEDVLKTKNWIETLINNSKRGVKNVSEFRNTLEGIVRMLAPLL